MWLSVFTLLYAPILQVGLIAILWRTIFNLDEKIKSYAWLPCLLWLMSSLIGWCYTNNMLENTMSLFTTAAIIISIAYINNQRQLLIHSVLIAIMLLLAFITKGPVALFPFALPVLMIGYQAGFKTKQAIIFTLLQLACFGIFFAILFSFPEPKNFLQHYYEWQVKKALTHTGADVYQPGQIFLDLFLATFLFMALALIRFLMRKFLNEDKAHNQIAIRMLLLGLCGTLPIALSAKQRNFYLLPAMTPIAVGVVAYLLPLAEWVEERIMQFKLGSAIKWLSGGMVVLAIVLCVHNKGAIIRDADILDDLKTANTLLQNETVIRADWSLYGEWSIRAYLLRLYGKKLCMPDETAPTHFYMTRPNNWGDRLPGNAPKVYSGKTFDLYRL